MLDNFISCSISFDTALIVMLFVCLLILILRQLAESKHFKSIGLHSCAHTHRRLDRAHRPTPERADVAKNRGQCFTYS